MSSNVSRNQKVIILLLIIGLFLPIFGFCQETPQEPPIKQPGTIEEGLNFIKNGIGVVLEKMPTVLKNIWREQVLSIWHKMWEFFKNIWENYIKTFFHNLWYSFLKPKIQFLIQKIKELLGKEIEEKKPIIEEEFQKEKEQMQEELPTVTKSFWQKFKDLIK